MRWNARKKKVSHNRPSMFTDLRHFLVFPPLSFFFPFFPFVYQLFEISIGQNFHVWKEFVYCQKGIVAVGQLIRTTMNMDEAKPPVSRASNQPSIKPISHEALSSKRKSRQDTNKLLQIKTLNFLHQILPKNIYTEYKKVDKDIGTSSLIALLSTKLSYYSEDCQESNGILLSIKILNGVIKLGAKTSQLKSIIPKLLNVLKTCFKLVTVNDESSQEMMLDCSEGRSRSEIEALVGKVVLEILRCLNSVTVEHVGKVSRKSKGWC